MANYYKRKKNYQNAEKYLQDVSMNNISLIIFYYELILIIIIFIHRYYIRKKERV